MVMANLAVELLRQGHSPIIVTAQWEPHWPTDVEHREAPVVRLPNPRQRGWGTIRYMSALGRWLRKRAGEIDLVYVSMLKHDAYAALGARRHGLFPVVLRAEGGGATGDCHWQTEARFGRRIKRRCLSADAFVAPSESILQELGASGYPRDRTHFIPNGVPIPPPRSAGRRSAARAALADVNRDLDVHDDAPIAVFTGRLNHAKGLYELLTAWRSVAASSPHARLWLVGEGSERDALYQHIVDYDLRGRILLPGAFDDVEEILQAADLFILPSHEEGMSLSLLEAMAAGLPIIATDIPGNRKLVEHQKHALLVPPREAGALATAIQRLLQDPALGVALGNAARQRAREEFSLTRMAELHLELFNKLIHRQKSADS